MTDSTTSQRPAPSARTRPVHVVPHTHWDREWYRPFERYRYRLVRTLDRVLSAHLPYFLLDGQTAVIDDYLALRPEQATVLRERIAEGRLGIGPWYVLVDEFLVSGEALVRNLQRGRAAMRSLGATGEGVGYLPDMFGHVAQMPQVLAQFGLDMAVVWRGVNPDTPRFRWIAPDGTGITAAWLPLGYYQTMFMEELSLVDRRAQLQKYVDAFGDEPSVWLLAGADHMAPRTDLPALVAAVQEDLPGAALEITSLRDALIGPAPVSSVTGELRDPAKAYILPGVLSARVPLKQANARAQTLLERYAEPLASLAWWGGRSYPAPFLAHAWQTLMLNHPHDSICGCSIDQVHREMWPRFAAVEQVAEELIADAVKLHDRPQKDPSVFVFNPTGWRHDGWVELTIDWPLADAPTAITLAGEGLLEVQALGSEDTETFRAEIDFNPDWFSVRRFRLAARVVLPGLGGATLKAVPADAAPVADGEVQASDMWLENEHLVVTVGDGKVVLLDRRTSQIYGDCHGFLDEGDAGDEYNFSPLTGDTPREARLVSSRLVARSPHAATLELAYALVVPAGLSPDRTRREGDEVTIALTSRLTLRAGSDRLEIETTLENPARDHRLRLVVSWAHADRPRVLADGPFGVFERPPVAMPELPVAKGVEAVMPEFPTSGFTALTDGVDTLAVAASGLYEAAWLDQRGLALTLLRGVGWLSRDDLRTRGGGAGPRFQTPEAQELGRHTFHYALVPSGGDWTAALTSAQQFIAPARAWVADGLAAPGLDLDVPGLVTSALVRSQDGQALVLRAFNATDHGVDVKVPTGARVRASRLDEEPGEDLVPGTTVTLRPHEIVTWRLTHA